MDTEPALLAEVDTAGFRAALAGDKPVLVDYVADHCVWCERIAPVLEAVLPEYRERLRAVKVNVQRHPDAAPPGGVRGTPTVALYRDGQLVMSKNGMMQRGQLVSFLDHWLDPANVGLAGA